MEASPHIILNKQESILVYCMVACGEVVLVDYSPLGTIDASSFVELAMQFIRKLDQLPAIDHPPTSSQYIPDQSDANNIFSFTADRHTFHVLTHDSFNFLVVSNESCNEHIALAFLQRIKTDFYRRYKDATKTKASFEAHSFDKDFRSTLKEHMQPRVDYSHKQVRFASKKEQLQEAKEIETGNMKRVHPDVQVDSQVINGENQNIHVENFLRQGKHLKRQAWIHQAKVRVVATLISFVLILSIWLLVCKGFQC